MKNEETQKIEHVLQLYSAQHKCYQPKMNAYGGCFVEATLKTTTTTKFFGLNIHFCNVFECVNKDIMELFIMELSDYSGSTSHKVQAIIRFQDPNDFIVSMLPSTDCRFLYAFTQAGFVLFFDISTGKCLFNSQIFKVKTYFEMIECIQETTVLLVVPNVEANGFLTIDQTGQIASINIDEKNFFNYIMTYLYQTRPDDAKEFAQSLVNQNFLSITDVMNTLSENGRNDIDKKNHEKITFSSFFENLKIFKYIRAVAKVGQVAKLN
ncbi:hypothetical protein RFI_20810 [Reticulomyxa filosa]|uniref:Uncharacterized protein n=1 Tax=Reticulomyxa filosa TaxID=46433 RepID=X6MRT9_RETFI|nr:hypothetical protein RFI_20810 [Reticulomyxa filosa]|eukprot:ETO16529.1 hypothetical protein RFI_20810 [Reticulomyxa filosa]